MDLQPCPAISALAEDLMQKLSSPTWRSAVLITYLVTVVINELEVPITTVTLDIIGL